MAYDQSSFNNQLSKSKEQGHQSILVAQRKEINVNKLHMYFEWGKISREIKAIDFFVERER